MVFFASTSSSSSSSLLTLYHFVWLQLNNFSRLMHFFRAHLPVLIFGIFFTIFISKGFFTYIDNNFNYFRLLCISFENFMNFRCCYLLLFFVRSISGWYFCVLILCVHMNRIACKANRQLQSSDVLLVCYFECVSIFHSKFVFKSKIVCLH